MRILTVSVTGIDSFKLTFSVRQNNMLIEPNIIYIQGLREQANV